MLHSSLFVACHVHRWLDGPFLTGFDTVPQLNKYPELKSFLVHGEAEYYQGVTVEFVKGRKAILKIFRDGTEVEEINLQEINDKTALHALFQEKGFQLKDTLTAPLEELIAANNQKVEEEKRQKEERRQQRIKEREERQKRKLEEQEKQQRDAENAKQEKEDPKTEL